MHESVTDRPHMPAAIPPLLGAMAAVPIITGIIKGVIDAHRPSRRTP